jgi:flagellar secretion chaperone FliS
MQPAYSGNIADQYLAQRINGASTEQLVVMLLEGGLRFLRQAIAAMASRDVPAKARLVNRVSAIIEELMVRLNHEDGGELVVNLSRLYEWWLNELFEGSQNNQADRLERIHRQMGEVRSSWEELQQHQSVAVPSREPSLLNTEGLVG